MLQGRNGRTNKTRNTSGCFEVLVCLVFLRVFCFVFGILQGLGFFCFAVVWFWGSFGLFLWFL